MVIYLISNHLKHYRGSRTLCTIHYIDWNQKKVLNLSTYKELPTTPIKLEANTELNYLQKMLSKNDQEITAQVLENLKPTRKMRKIDMDVDNQLDPTVKKEDLNDYSIKKISSSQLPIVEKRELDEMKDEEQ